MSLPLEGVRVLDFSTLLPGPYATQLLADMGAEVLRIEAPNRPDLLKVMPPMVGQGKAKVSAAHASINRNKKSIAIDLKNPAAKSIIEKLISDYDVVIEQFRPGVMQRLGLDYEVLSSINPKLVYCSITGYGQTGPYKDRAGHDINYLALSGLASYSGRKETGPVLSATQIADIAGGSHHAVMSILAALLARPNTGKGAYLDISMADAALSLNTMFGAGALVSGQDPELGSGMLNGGLFYDYYETADGKFISIGSLEPNFAMSLLQTLELSDWLSKIADQRPETQTSLRAAIAEKISAQTQAKWIDIFGKLDACVEPVITVNEAAEHPQFKARKMFIDVQLESGESVKQIASALPFDRVQEPSLGAPLGAHTDEVLGQFGFDAGQLEELKKSGCIKQG
ncbi:carnitine dehydratase [Oleiphilus sp. HI0125]|uniref:CaiB/BaiF CoA transferase family protein n=1 Tax=Oleiphilus sp. HI0125 TaxID=1822266 RepID=UPI0007C2D7EB|nr:CaiB/BaiF CoA-transferase family protein [Oleiphilus sp. HI0125]KZZ61702.1 carnitine dehydratase [Oleiphilus sp. HI0125]